MIAKIGRGGAFRGLLLYLAGEGKENEHTDPHLVAGDASIMAWWGRQELGSEDAAAIARELESARQLHGAQVSVTRRDWQPEGGVAVRRDRRGEPVKGDAHVWHCSLSLHPHEGPLSDEKWEQITGEFMAKMGFDDPQDPRAPAQWVAVRHGLSTGGNDHVHIAASVVRVDGTKVSVYNDYKRASAACKELEQAHGLRVIEGRSAQFEPGVQPYSMPDVREHQRQNEERADQGGRPREELARARAQRTVRGCAAAAESEAEFVGRLRSHGLAVRPRFAQGTDEVVTGYSVALRGQDGRAESRWYAGGKLAKDLNLAQLRADHGWSSTPDSSQEAAAEWRAGTRGTRPVHPGQETRRPAERDWRQWHQVMDELLTTVRSGGEAGGQEWVAAARQAAGALAAMSVRNEADGGPLSEASRALARSAWLSARVNPAGDQPHAPVTTSTSGAAAVLLLKASGGRTKHLDALLLTQMVRLAQAVHEVHKNTGRVHEAAAIERSVRRDLATVRAALPRVRTIEQYDDPRAASPQGSPAPPAHSVVQSRGPRPQHGQDKQPGRHHQKEGTER